MLRVFPLEQYLEDKGFLRAAFLAWSAALGKILTMDNLKKRHDIVKLIGVVCAGGMSSLWIIFSSIVKSLAPYGMPFSVVFSYLG
jgi:hypothetical protein